MTFELKKRVKIIKGIWTGKKGIVDALAGEDVPKRIGVRVLDTNTGVPIVWYRPEEIEKEN